MPTLKPGQRFDQYEILGFIAKGGMGEVCNAPFRLEHSLKEKIAGSSHDKQDKTQAHT